MSQSESSAADSAERIGKSERLAVRLSRAESIAFVESLLSLPELAADAPLARAISRYKQSQGME